MIPRSLTGLSDRALHRWAAAAVGFYVVSLLASSVGDLTDNVSESSWGAAGVVGALGYAVMITLFPAVGLLIVRQQPRNRIGWLLLAIGAAWGVAGFLDAYVRWALLVDPGSLPLGPEVQAVSAANWLPPIVLMGIVLIVLFPDGRPPSPRWRVLVWAGVAIVALGWPAISLSPGPLEDVPVPGRENPLGIESLRTVSNIVLVVVLPLLPVCMVAAAAALVQRFRRSQGVERLQLKWLTSAGAFVALAFLAAMVVSLSPSLGMSQDHHEQLNVVLQSVSLLSFGLIPVAIGIAVTRHGLYGIDAIISRALVFGALGAFITSVYVGIVVGIGALIGEREPSVALSVVATAVVAVAFQPVRAHVQRLANRLVYGERATPYEVLSDFATRMAGTYTTGELLPRMAQLVGQCLRGAQVEVWLVEGTRLVREVSWSRDGVAPADSGDEVPRGAEQTLPVDLQVPVRHHGELLGIITVTKPAGEPVTPPEDALLGHVASQAGLVLRNVRLIDDLRSSAERLVVSQDGERRRLERNLHDGAQQSLVSVALLLRMALARVGDDPDGIAPAMTEASSQLQRAIDELRELARGIHPAILTERGLGPAVTSLAERSSVPVQVDVALPQRPPATIEGTLYFVVAEALTNVAKYASASSVTVTLVQEGDVVTAVVTDDGVGGADPERGSGLLGLADRIAAVDGSIDVHSPPGGGTRITCRVPVSASRPVELETAS